MSSRLTRRDLLGTAVLAAFGGTAVGQSADAQTSGLPQAKPEDIGLDPRRLQVAYGLLEKWTADRTMPGAAMLVGRMGKTVPARFFGRHGPEADAEPIRPDALFYMASVTKPVTYLAAMILVERGQLNLTD